MQKVILLSLIVILLINISIYAQKDITVYKVQTTGKELTKPVSSNNLLVGNKINLITVSMPFSNCLPCVNEINAIATKLKSIGVSDNVLVYSVIVSGFKLPSEAALYALNGIEKNKWSFPIYVDTNFALAKDLGYYSFPKTLLIDAQGKLLFAADLEKDTVFQLRTTKLFNTLINHLEKSYLDLYDFSIGQLEKLAGSSKTGFSTEVKTFGFKEVDNLYIITNSNNEKQLLSFNQYSSYRNTIELRFTSKSYFDKYKERFLKDGYKEEFNLDVDSDNKKNYGTFKKDRFKVAFYETNYNDVKLFTISLSTLNLKESKNPVTIYHFSIKELEDFVGYGSDQFGVYVISKGFKSYEVWPGAKDCYMITIDNKYKEVIKLSSTGFQSIDYMFPDLSSFNKYKNQVIQEGYKQVKNEVNYKEDEIYHFTFVNEKYKIAFFKSKTTKTYNLTIHRLQVKTDDEGW